MAEVKWFYRVSELPEAVYLLLMEDRKKGICCNLPFCTLWLHSYAKTNALFVINYLHICKPHPSMMP
jgi:hypothetical protein